MRWRDTLESVEYLFNRNGRWDGGPKGLGVGIGECASGDNGERTVDGAIVCFLGGAFRVLWNRLAHAR